MKKVNFPKARTVTAHTGCENTPDNTIESIIKAFECGADIFEIDIRFKENGIPILSHNEPIGAEPELDEVFTLMAKEKKILCNLDIKETDNLKAVLSCAQKHGVTDRIFYTGITEDIVDIVKADTPEIPYYLNLDVISAEEASDSYINELISRVKSSGAIGINSYFYHVSEETVSAFHKNGLAVSVWTVNEEEDMRRMIKTGADNITTRKPVLLKALLSV